MKTTIPVKRDFVRWSLYSLLGGLVAVIAFVAQPSMALAQETAEIQSSLSRGGKLYDKWYEVVGVDPPETTHPSYPAVGKMKGADTWRCKECHGWDHLGKDGAYGQGKHFTGIKGIRGMLGADPADIVAILKDKTHGYTDDMLEEEDFQDLAMFVSKGQVDMDKYIDRATKSPKGDPARGVAYFSAICAQCHSQDGTRPKSMEAPLGKLVSSNPWEVMHKIINGQPAEKMPSLRVLDRQAVVDTMAYLTTLPKEK